MSQFKTATLNKIRETVMLKFSETDMKTLEKIATLRGVSYSHNGWECPISVDTIKKLKEWGFEMSTSLKDWNGEPLPLKKIDIPENDSGMQLRPYQVEGVSFIESKKGRALIADDMGLGKTVQALSWLQLHPEHRPALIICPSVVKINWKRETKKWVDNSNIEILSGQTPYKIKKRTNIVIINYDILSYWKRELKEIEFTTVIADEAHYIKNSNANRTKAFKSLSFHSPYLIGLTGTPIENKPEELFNIIHTINPNVFSNYYSFLYRFCGAKKGVFGIQTGKATNVKELHDILKRTIMIRRKKEDVLKELPPKQIVPIPLAIDNREEYAKAENAFIHYLETKFQIINKETEEELKTFAKRNGISIGEELSQDEVEMLIDKKINKATLATALVQMEELKQLAVEGKLNQIIEWVQEFLESGEKLVVFAIHKKIIDKLMIAFPEALKIDGSVSIPNRQKVVDIFQKDTDKKLLIANIKAAGIGITLTAASNVAIIEFPWSPSIVTQAIDRVHRISQLRQVTAWILHATETIEEKIITVLKEKEKLIAQILDGKEDVIDTSVIFEVLKTYKK